MVTGGGAAGPSLSSTGKFNTQAHATKVKTHPTTAPMRKTPPKECVNKTASGMRSAIVMITHAR
jgi:hypothetical protein